MRGLMISLVALLTSGALLACEGEADGADAAAPDAATADDAGAPDVDEDEEREPRVGYEILQAVAPDRIVTWLNNEMTQAEFDAIELPQGWFKNQPREGEPDRGAFARSPDAARDGEFTVAEHFGHAWTHVATVVETGISLDPDGLLTGARVHKYHEVGFDAGRRLPVIVSPTGDVYVRISRDAGRASDTPTMPETWREAEYATDAPLTLQLPERTLVIRADNEDSFQGPVPLDVGQPAPPLPLTGDLCDDPAAIEALADTVGGLVAGGGVNPEQVQRMVAAPTDGPFYMVNLIRYRERAQYPDGRQTDLTGREANALYAPVEFLQAIGARVVFNTEVDDQIDGDEPTWESVAIVEYPCPLAFFAMLGHPEFQARAIHKTAGVAQTIVMVTERMPVPAPADPEQSQSPHPPTAEDPAFDLIHVMDFHEQAQYAEGSDEPPRTGREAWEAYQAGGAGASAALGIYLTGRLVVQGVFIGDDRSWDEVLLVRMPSLAGFRALQDDETRREGDHHRQAALAHDYSMVTYPALSQIPGSPGGGGMQPPPATADGTGTLCQSDDDCPGGGVDLCLGDSGAGFCTREGCEGGGCEAPYVCCRDCAPIVQGRLPFDGSACLPASVVEQLTAAPASCTCD